MRLLNAMRTVDRAAGGPVEWVIQTGRVLERLGHRSDVVSLDAKEERFVRDYPGNVAAVGPGLGRYGYAPTFVPWMKRNAGNYDAVLVHGVWDYNGLGVWRALRKSQPYFVFPHGMLDPWFKHTYPLKHLKKWMYWPWGTYRMLRDACGVLFTAEDERILARQSFWLYRCRERVVNYGTAECSGDAAAQRDVFLRAFPEIRGKRVVLFLGRIHVKKGCDLLIRAFAKIAERDADLHLVVAGPDQCGERSRLEALAQSLGIMRRITWTGMLSGDAKAGAFRVADVFALFSHQENFGVALAEALAFGVPVLITDKVNIWREIRADDAGFVARDDLAGAIRLLEQWETLPVDEKVQMRSNARQCFEQRFDIERSAQSLIETLRSSGISG